MKKNNKFAEYFESWAGTVAEGAWALPDTQDEVDQIIELLSQPLPVGVDAQNATNALYNLIGDDRLFDRLEELAETDPNADGRDIIQNWLQDNLPQIYQQIENEIGDPDYPAEPAEDNQEVDESYTPPPVMINGKQVDLGSIELDGVESWDSPDYADAYASAATFTDGTPLTDDELDILSDQHGDVINMRAHDMLEGNEYGAAIPGGTENMLATTNEDDDQEDQLADIESIQSAIIRRILNSINDHSELLKKAGPEGIMNAASDVASFHAPMEEIGTSDISIMVREVYREVGVDYPEDEVAEAKDKVMYDPKTGKLTGWEHEGDWKKSKGKKKDPVGKIHNMSDIARRRTEKMSQDETLEEAFERLVNEGAINVGDMIRDKTQPEIQGKVVGDQDENYIIKVEGEHYHILKLNAEVIKKGLLEDQITDKLQSFVGHTFYVPSEGQKGTVSNVADQTRFSNSLVVDLANNTTTVVHFDDLKPIAETPGPVTQLWQKLKATITGGAKPKYQPKYSGQVSDPMADIKHLAGLK